MGEVKFTPGPWRWRYRDDVWAGDERVAEPLSDRNREADAHLIAAAPELYEAAEKALAEFAGDEHTEQQGEATNLLRAALAKARGDE